ncbi:MAG: PPA1309 family protein [Actinomycetes bacterium]
MSAARPTLHVLTSAVLELEAFVNEDGWDQPPRLFALALARELVEREPDLAEAMGLGPQLAGSEELIPVEQEWAPDDVGVDDALAHIAWPEQVVGVAITMERILLPPDAEADLDEDGELSSLVDQAMGHPAKREVRIAVAVMRDGRETSAIRLRENDADDEVLTGQNLVPGMIDALAATLS